MKLIISTVLSLVLIVSTFGQSTLRVLRTESDKAQNVTVQNFYPVNTTETPNYLSNKFTLDMWIKKPDGVAGGYDLSDGYGGAHAILFGVFKASNSSLYAITGNIRSETSPGVYESFSFSSPPIIDAGKWHNYAVELNENVITTFVDGIPISRHPFSGKRISGAGGVFDGSAGTLYIGGSDHINSDSLYGQFRLIEGHAVYGGQAYTVQVSYSDSMKLLGTNTVVHSSLLFDFSSSGIVVPDLSQGYNKKKHNGRLRNASNGLYYERNGGELPKYVDDKYFPFIGEQETDNQAPSTPPSNALIFDSFGRANQTSLTDNPTLGVTEVGNKTWSVNLPFFIQFGQGVFAGNGYYATALVESETSNGTLKVDRIAGYETGLRFRTTDQYNGYALFTTGGYLILDKLVGGGIASRQTAPLSACSYLTVTYNVGNIQASCGSAVINATDTTYTKATKVGLYAYSPTDMNRYDNFTLLP